MKITILIWLVAGLNACETNKPEQANQGTFKSQNPSVSESKIETAPITTPNFPKAGTSGTYSYQLIPAENATFGYEIKQGNRTLIRQITIPGLSGNSGFATKADAEKVAELVIIKLKNGEMPPSVSEAEMKRVGAIK
jgi:hypothetical protein